MINRRAFFKALGGGVIGLGLAGARRAAPALSQPESGVLWGWVALSDEFGSGAGGAGVAFYDLVRAQYHVALLDLGSDARYSVYLVEMRPPETPEGQTLDWSAWGGTDTDALKGDDGKFLHLGEIRTNDRGNGALSVSLGEENSSLVRRYNMIGIFPGRRSSGQSLTEAILACNGDFYGVVPPS